MSQGTADTIVTRPSLPSYVRSWATASPSGTAVYAADTTVSWQELDRLTDGFVLALKRRGVAAGDRVMLVGGNSLGWLVGFLAVQRLGAVVAPTNNRISAAQLREQADVLEARAILHDELHRELVSDALAAPSSVQVHDHQDLLLEAGGFVPTGAEAPADAPTDHPALISFTSGTSGTPKGAVISHSALVAMAKSFAEYFGSGPRSSTLVMVPLFHNTGFVDQFAHMLAAGGATGLVERYSTSKVVAELRERPVSFLAAVPSMVRMLMSADGSHEVFSGLHTIMYGGSPMPGAWSSELRAAYPHLGLVHAYGLSEFTSVATFLPPELVLTRGESVGLPLPGVEVRIVTDEGATAGPRCPGEVWLRGETRMDGYWRRPDLTRDRFVDDWLRTGDVGYLDADGLLWLNGRIDDVINRGGEKVLPAHVESCIVSSPDIREASVFGYADPVLQNRVAAAVSLRPGAEFDEAQMRQHLNDLLPDYAIPDRWLVMDDLPHTGSGKVDRRSISDTAMAGQRPPQES